MLWLIDKALEQKSITPPFPSCHIPASPMPPCSLRYSGVSTFEAPVLIDPPLPQTLRRVVTSRSESTYLTAIAVALLFPT